MKIAQLRSFHYVALAGSFTKAARALFLTQPAVSQQIQILEDEFGVSLFNRSGKTVRLTSEGEILLEHTTKLFQVYEEIQRLSDRLKGLEGGKISIGATGVMGTYFLPKIIGRFNKQYPAVEIDLRMGNSYFIHNLVLNGEVEVGLGSNLKSPPRLKHIHLHREPLILVCAPDSALARIPCLDQENMNKEPFIWREMGTKIRFKIQTWFEDNMGMSHPRHVVELENIEATKRMLIEGYGYSMLPEIAVRYELESGQLKRLHFDGAGVNINYHLYFMSGGIFSLATETFLRELANSSMFSHHQNLRDNFPILSIS